MLVNKFILPSSHRHKWHFECSYLSNFATESTGKEYYTNKMLYA